MDKVDYLILGHGYTAQFLIQEIEKKNGESRWASTSRTDPSKLSFDLTDMDSWGGLPEARSTFWTFPPAPTDLVKEFYSENKKKLGQLIVVGSTSGFKTFEDSQEVHEESELDVSIERVASEKYLLDQGAIAVMSAGIYGPKKNPVDWVKNGYVGKSEKLVNMIHVQDLSKILLGASDIGKPGNLYIASDNVPLKWAEVIELWEDKGLLSNVPEKASKRSSKKINSTRTLSELQIELNYQNFAEVVGQGLLE